MMARTSLLLLAALAAHVTGAAAMPHAVSPLKGRIVNGKPAKPGEFPSQVSLQVNGGHWCGASIISQDWAVTAAHCVTGHASSDVLEVRAGVTNLNEEGSLHAIDVIIAHSEYSPGDAWRHDIAVLKVSPAFPLDGKTVAPVRLPKQDEEVPDGANVTVIGWGALRFQGDLTDELQKVDLHKYNFEECERIWREWVYEIYPTQICAARFEDINYGTCSGDSGGPLLYGGVLEGLTSWGYECATPPYPTVFTRVASYVDWINQQTNALRSSGTNKSNL